MALYETMQERVARILAELDIRAEPRLRYVAICALGRCALAHGFCKRRARFKFNSRLKLAFKF